MADDWTPVTAAPADDWQPIRKSVTAPAHIPQAFLERFSIEPDPVENLETKAGPNLAGRVLNAIYEGGAAGFGDTPLGLPPEAARGMQRLGIFQDPEKARDITSGIRFVNEAGIRAAYNAIEATFRGLNSATYAAGALGGQLLAEATGGNEAEQARARRDGAHGATASTRLSGSQRGMRRTSGPQGERVNEPIGSVARPDQRDHSGADRRHCAV